MVTCDVNMQVFIDLQELHLSLAFFSLPFCTALFFPLPDQVHSWGLSGSLTEQQNAAKKTTVCVQDKAHQLKASPNPTRCAGRQQETTSSWTVTSKPVTA